MVGIGPGSALDRTRRAEDAVRNSTVIAGYGRYLDLIGDLVSGQERIVTGMTKEVERCRAALNKAREGHVVALVSSGDAGIYGMAGLAIEIAAEEGIDVPIEIVPGITSASAAGARMGAPLMCDYAAISLSDLLVPWEVIRARLEAAAFADLVAALYNPRSRKRTKQLEEAAAIFRKHRPGGTPVGIGTDIGTPEEKIVASDLDRFLDEEIGMRSIVIIGNRSSKFLQGWIVTPRGYKLSF